MPGTCVSSGALMGSISWKNPLWSRFHFENLGQLGVAVVGDQAGRKHQKVHALFLDDAFHFVLVPEDEVVRLRVLFHIEGLPDHVANAQGRRLLVELVEALAVAGLVVVEDRALGLGAVLFGDDGLFGGHHAADLGAVVEAFVARDRRTGSRRSCGRACRRRAARSRPAWGRRSSSGARSSCS